MKRPCQAKYNRVTQAVIQQIPRQLPERDSAHRAAESHQSGYRTHDALGNRSAGSTMTRVDQDCWPKYARLNIASAMATAHMGHKNNGWHDRGAKPEREFSRRVKRKISPHQIAGEPSACQTAEAGCGIRNPCEGSHRFHVKAARVVQDISAARIR